MGLDKTALAEKIKAAFEKAKNTPAPEDPNDADQVQVEILETLSADLANAIYDFVTEAEVKGITTSVVLDIPNEIGTGTQTGSGFIE